MKNTTIINVETKKITNKITYGTTNEQQTNNKQITTNKNDKNIYNIYSPSDDGQDISSKEKELADNFDKIWKIYPRKDGKSTAFNHYKSWLKGKKYAGRTVKLDNRQMWYAVKEYAELMTAKKVEKKYIKTGKVFFNETIMEYVKEEK